MRLVGFFLLLLWPAPAAAAWEPAGALDGRAPAGFSFSPAGTALVPFVAGERIGLAEWRAGRAKVTRTLPGRAFAGHVDHGRSRVMLFRDRGTPERPRVYETQVSRSGRLLSVRRLPVMPRPGTYAAAAARSARGEIALAWVENVGVRLRLRALLRPPGGAFRLRATRWLGTDSHPGAAAVAVAYRADGGLVVAYAAQRSTDRVEALIGRPGAFRRQVLGRHRGISAIAAASGGAGRVVVAWQTQDGGEEANRPAETRVALLSRRARKFSPTQLFAVSDGLARPAGAVSASVGADGTAAVLWSDPRRGFTQAVTLAIARPGARFGTPIALDTDGASGDAVVGADGRVLALWTTPAGARAWVDGVVEPLSDRPADAAVGATDPSTGRVVAAWAEGSRLRFARHTP